MAASTPQEKEWVPRSHIAGPAFGTLSRAAANKNKLFTQLIDEEGDGHDHLKGRPEISSAITEVAMVKCHCNHDGRSFVKVMTKLNKSLVPGGQVFHHVYCLDEGTGSTRATHEGSGIRPSEYMIVTVGTQSSFVDAYKNREPEDNEKLKDVIKTYKSTIYTTKAKLALKGVLKELNAVPHFTYDIAESPNYRFETGSKLVAEFLKNTGNDLNVRVERIETNDAAGMGQVEAAIAECYAADYRNAKTHKWRPEHREAIGEAVLLNTPLAFILKLDETHAEIVIMDLLSNFDKDAKFAKKNDTVTSAVAAVKSMTVYTHSKKSESKIIFANGKAEPKFKGKKTYTQGAHIFGGAAEFKVVPAVVEF